MSLVDQKIQYRKLLTGYDHNIEIQDACACAGLMVCRSMLFANATLVVRKFSDLPAEDQDNLLQAASQTSSIPDILEKSGYNKAEQQQQLREAAADPPLLPQDRKKRTYTHSTLSKKKKVRGVEKESVKTCRNPRSS